MTRKKRGGGGGRWRIEGEEDRVPDNSLVDNSLVGEGGGEDG